MVSEPIKEEEALRRVHDGIEYVTDADYGKMDEAISCVGEAINALRGELVDERGTLQQWKKRIAELERERDRLRAKVKRLSRMVDARSGNMTAARELSAVARLAEAVTVLREILSNHRQMCAEFCAAHIETAIPAFLAAGEKGESQDKSVVQEQGAKIRVPDTPPRKLIRSPMCICGNEKPHYVPPFCGEPGFFACDEGDQAKERDDG